MSWSSITFCRIRNDGPDVHSAFFLALMFGSDVVFPNEFNEDTAIRIRMKSGCVPLKRPGAIMKV